MSVAFDPLLFGFDWLDVVTFAAAAAGVLWVWWGVPKWQVAACFMAIGAIYAVSVLLAYYGVGTLFDGVGWGSMPKFLRPTWLAPCLGMLAASLLALLLGLFRKARD